ncbi:MAG: YegP family protein [Lachnospiraceae bacterium]|nr:YegP family protein [Lachnospiraceae bacterium]
MGTFMIRNTDTGTKFDLLGEDGQFLAGSQVYKTIKTCRNGIESVKVCAPAAMLEDQTEAGFAVQKSPKFEMYKDAAGELRYRLRSRNGQIIASGNSFGTKEECLEVIDAIRAAAPDAPVIREDGRGRGRTAGAVKEAEAAAAAEVVSLIPESFIAGEGVRSIPEAAETGSETVGVIVEEIKQTTEEIVEETTETAAEAAAAVSEVAGAAEEKAAEVVEAAEEKAEETVEAVEEKAEEVVEAAEEKADEVVEAAEAVEEEAGEAVEEEAAEAAEEAEDEAEEADGEEDEESDEEDGEEGEEEEPKETNYRVLTVLFGAAAALCCILAICFGVKSASLQKNVDLLTAEKEQMEVILAEKNAQAENALVERGILIDEKEELTAEAEELSKSVEELTQATAILQEENDELKGQIHNTIEGIEGILSDLKATAGIEDEAILEEDVQEAEVEEIELIEEPAAEEAAPEAEAAEEAAGEEEVQPEEQNEAAATEIEEAAPEEEAGFTNVSENLKDQLKQEMMAGMQSAGQP